MKSNSGYLSSLVLTVLLVFCLFLLARESFAAEEVDVEDVPKDGKIEIVYPAEQTAAYKERRGPWSPFFSIGVDQVLPESFRSKLTDDNYETLFGNSPVPMFQAELGTKYNFGLGSIGLFLIYGHGVVEDGRSGGETKTVHELTLDKFGGGAVYIMDNLFSEPYVAPYIEGQLLKFGWEEKRHIPNGEVEGTTEGETDMSSALVAGLLFQLNWLDPGSAIAAQNSSGLDNAYLDLFVSQYNTSESENDPNFQTGTNFGAGLRLEF
ncbi:MAG: hypothetical protein ACAH59_01250 [Pseudobdellovibrionaceae bacterium]